MNESVIKTIDLSLPEGKHMLFGSAMARQFREQHSLDELDKQDGIVKVRVLADIMSSSFILGLFSKSVKKLGEKGFYKKYNFVDAPDDIMENIRINVKYSASEGVALS